MTISIVYIFILVGLALIVIALLGGGIEVKEIKIPALQIIPRIFSFSTGCAILTLCFLRPDIFQVLNDNKFPSVPPPIVNPSRREFEPKPSPASPPTGQPPTPAEPPTPVQPPTPAQPPSAPKPLIDSKAAQEPDLAPALCRGEYGKRSRPTTSTINFHIRNTSENTIRVYWINFEGRRQWYADVLPGHDYRARSYIYHLWAIRADPITC